MYPFEVFLLIVPYGIETEVLLSEAISEILLIVPYGIETTEYLFLVRLILKLLIVPYGIETAIIKNRFSLI